MMRIVIAAVALCLAALGAAAQDGPQGVAIAQSPEGAFQACHGSSADQTLACARQKCNAAEGGGTGCACAGASRPATRAR